MSTTDEAIQAVRQRFQDFQVEHRISIRQAAISAGLHRNTLYGFEKADWLPTTNTLKKLEQMMREYPKA